MTRPVFTRAQIIRQRLVAEALGYAAVIGVSVTAVACIYGLAELLAHWGEIA